VVYTVGAALHGNIGSLILSCVLGIKTVLEEGSIGVTELKYLAVFMVKRLIYIPNAVGSDFFLLLQKNILFSLSVSASEQQLTSRARGHLFLPLYLLPRFRRSLEIAKSHNLLRHVSPSVCPQEKNSASTTGISMKFSN
jgi:hypothetical protein